jgi:hypothetical protein
MSLSKIKKCLKQVRENEDALYWCERELVDLLMAVSEHVLHLGNEHEEAPIKEVPSGLMTIKDFVKKYKFFSDTCVYKHCNDTPEFSSKCAFRVGSKWYVYPEAAYDFLKNTPIFKKRLERLSNN